MTPEHAQQVYDRTADAAAVGAVIATSISLASTLQVVQIVAGIVAIVSGICASIYYIRRIRAEQ